MLIMLNISGFLVSATNGLNLLKKIYFSVLFIFSPLTACW